MKHTYFFFVFFSIFLLQIDVSLTFRASVARTFQKELDKDLLETMRTKFIQHLGKMRVENLKSNILQLQRDAFLRKEEAINGNNNNNNNNDVEQQRALTKPFSNFGAKVGRYSGQIAPLSSYLLSYDVDGASNQQSNLVLG